MPGSRGGQQTYGQTLAQNSILRQEDKLIQIIILLKEIKKLLMEKNGDAGLRKH